MDYGLSRLPMGQCRAAVQRRDRKRIPRGLDLRCRLDILAWLFGYAPI
jgi:hypothetical protein